MSNLLTPEKQEQHLTLVQCKFLYVREVCKLLDTDDLWETDQIRLTVEDIMDKMRDLEELLDIPYRPC